MNFKTQNQSTMSTEEKAQHRLKRKMEQRKHRQNKRLPLISPSQAWEVLHINPESQKQKQPRKLTITFQKSQKKETIV